MIRNDVNSIAKSHIIGKVEAAPMHTRRQKGREQPGLHAIRL
jgi:hypothetical protein